MVKTNVEDMYGLTMTEESDMVLACEQDADDIAQQFQQEEDEDTNKRAAKAR